ncbi:hypothetical protein [Niallia sp. 03133]|uniref:hypothetical protein n=1 Tax=Niallia sp. 03133 TaxID=3458060 RepID=UPI0040448BFA
MLKKILLLSICYFFISGLSNHTSAEQKDALYPIISYDIQPLYWSTADKIIPRYSKFSIIDIETGREFHVQRRAGSQHADVQPLTTADTKIMKEIYKGKWSWKRRAIIVMVNDQWIAASMHGMPHGAGVLNNNFPGHFCIHFLGSTTHKTDKMDLSHKLMVYKAAGILPDYLSHLNPNELIQSFVAGLKEQDTFILSQVTIGHISWKKELTSLENITLTHINVNMDKDEIWKNNRIDAEVEWQVYIKNSKPIKQNKKLTLIRSSPLEPWKVVVEKNYFSKNQEI